MVASGLHCCRVINPAWSLNQRPQRQDSSLPKPPAVGASFWLCAGIPGPRLLPLIVRSLHSACPLCPAPWATARPHPDQRFHDLSFFESPAWRSRSSISEPSVFPSAAAAMLVALCAGLCPGLWRQGAQALCFHPVLPCLLHVVLQAPKGQAVSHKGHILLPGPAPAMSPPLKQTAECREDRMA